MAYELDKIFASRQLLQVAIPQTVVSGLLQVGFFNSYRQFKLKIRKLLNVVTVHVCLWIVEST